MQKKGEKGTRTALYRKYRSRSLDEIVGQSQVTEILKRSLKHGKVAHAYLLTGPKGTGKTSIARILAHEINRLPYNGEETHLDIIEIDAASNNGVEDVRDLRDKVQLAPISAAKKIYIIDEVHMLSKPAFNALLKTLEEPPEHIVFILATTDLHKVPATIISRTQHFAFHSINEASIAEHLQKIAKSEGIKITDDAVAAIAARGDGSLRNSISLLDQMSSFADDKDGITLDIVQSTLGLAPSEAVDALLAAVAEHDVAGVITRLSTLEKQGIQPVILADQLILALRDQLAHAPSADWRITLLDALLGVANSPQPQLKLLTVLVGAIPPSVDAVPPRKTAAASASKPPALVIKEPIEKPKKPKTRKSNTKDRNSKFEILNSKHLEWQKLLDETKKHAVALYSVLSKCGYEFDGETLMIYAGRKFNKTKLDEPKYLAQLNEALAKVGITDIIVVTLPTSKPPADEKLARVAEMMGGGHEVELDEVK